MKDLAQEAVVQETAGPQSAELGNIFRHLWLLKEVAASAGIDLSAALKDGRLSGLDYAQLVTTCRGGGCSNSCALWLSSKHDGVPEFCPSADVLERLKP